jgi:hypothetical protein
MNILQQEDIIKGLPDQALQEEAKRPSGQVPQFLVVSEIQRRTDMRKRYQDPNQQQPQGTIADQITQEGIASVQPQQPMQGQQQQGQPMPMRVGGMTPFMRKYAGGGVVRMQEGGITPHEMAQMDAQMMAQKYPFLSGSRDEILQGLSTVDPNDVSYISSMFNGAPEIEAVLASRSKMPQPPMPIENITEPSLFALDGVNTLTPDGRRPNPNTPSVDTLEQFSNAFKEDAARAENLLATLDDSTAKEKEAISNPVNVNLPKIRTLGEIGRDAPQMLPLSDRKKNLTLDQQLNMSSQPKGANAELNQARREQLLLRSEMLNGSSGKISGLSDAPTGGKTTTTAEPEASRIPLGRTESNMQGALMTEERIEELNAPFFNQFDVDLKKTPDERRAEKARSLIDFAEQQGSPSRQQLIANSQPVKPPVAEGNNAVISDGANNEGSGDKGVNNSNKAVNLLNNAFALDLDATKKEAFAMAMIQLGAGIAKGDLAEGLSNAGVAASGVLERSRDRSDKQLDREIQRKYYDDKRADAQATKDAQASYRLETFMAAYRKEKGMIDSPEEQIRYENKLRASLGLPLIELNTGESIGATGGNQSSKANGVVGSYSQKTGLTPT